MSNYDIKQVIVVRKDLNMRKGKMVAQGAHASMKVLLDAGERQDMEWGGDDITPQYVITMDDAMVEWIEGKFAKICVSVDSEEELLELFKKAEQANLPCSLIQDAGYTEFDGVPTYTAIAIGPAENDDINKITGELKLL